MPWIDNVAPACPFELKVVGNKITWNVHTTGDEMNDARFFVVYRYRRDQEKFLESARNIVAVTGKKYLAFENEIPEGVYRISSLDRLNNESQLSDALIIK